MSEIRVPPWPGEGPLPGCNFCGVLTWWKGLWSSVEPLYKGTHPIPEGSAIMAYVPPDGSTSEYCRPGGLAS